MKFKIPRYWDSCMTEISNHSEEEARRLIVDLSHRQKPISEAIEYFETQYINDPDKDKVCSMIDPSPFQTGLFFGPRKFSPMPLNSG